MILFIDDEERRLDSYVMELRISGYSVNFFKEVDKAFEFFQDHHDAVKLLILDIMMPPRGIFLDEDTDSGLRTGIRFMEKVRTISTAVPILFFSNVIDASVREQLSKRRNCWFVAKDTCYPSDLVDKIGNIIPGNAQKGKGD